jgi:hypothetical protein
MNASKNYITAHNEVTVYTNFHLIYPNIFATYNPSYVDNCTKFIKYFISKDFVPLYSPMLNNCILMQNYWKSLVFITVLLVSKIKVDHTESSIHVMSEFGLKPLCLQTDNRPQYHLKILAVQ